MKKLGVIIISVLLISLTACSSTEFSGYTYSDYISDTKGDMPKYTVKPVTTQTTVPETTLSTEITTVPESVPETSGTEETTAVPAEESLPAATAEQTPTETEQQIPETTSTEPQKTTVPTETTASVETTAPTAESSQIESVDVDLTAMSSVMVYSEVYNMLGSPESYIGKTIKMKGQYTSYENPDTGRVYHACIVKDATACCAQGLEFTLAEDYSVYPSEGEEVTVIGTFSVYQEGYFLFGELTDSRFV